MKIESTELLNGLYLVDKKKDRITGTSKFLAWATVRLIETLIDRHSLAENRFGER